MATALGKKIGSSEEGGYFFVGPEAVAFAEELRRRIGEVSDEPIEEDIPLFVRAWQKGETIKGEDQRERERPEGG